MSFNEQAYLAANRDVADAVARGELKSGEEHYNRYGRKEGRSYAAEVDHLYSQLQQGYAQTPEESRDRMWRSEGHGSKEANMRAMAESLAKKGVYDLSDLRIQPRQVLGEQRFVLTKDGGLLVVEDRGETYGTRPATAAEKAKVQTSEEYQKALKELAGDRLGEMSQTTFSAQAPTGVVSGSLVNSRTGEVIDDNKDNSDLRQGFFIDKTSAGKGKTHFNLYPQFQQDEAGAVTGFSLLPGVENRATGLKKFMQDFGPMLSVAGMVLGLPGAAGTFGSGAGIASAGLKGLTAANAFDQGNWLAGIGSLAGMAPGLNLGFGLNMDPGTLGTIKNVGTLANVGSAVQNKDYMGALSGAANLMPGTGSLDIGGVPVDRTLQGLGALGSAKQGDYVGAMLGGLGAAGQKNLPGTDVDLRDAGGALSIYRNIKGDKPMGAMQDIIAMNRRRRPQETELAAGGPVPGLDAYMQTRPMANRSGVAALGV